eukprot:TRINITY_DN1648_c1_g1_i1.p1 TRINITY_DN1648_c1_g1~~TRINITY_DN1648_c1_g1_i1.p1  ORF type:complete len:384 (-),score=94.15 TRINITY_DN1648_c1_g1_i1:99-1205(-)
MEQQQQQYIGDKKPMTPPQAKKQTGWAVVGLGQLTLEEILPAIKMTKRCQIRALVSGSPEKAKPTAEAYNIPENRLYSYDNFDSIKDADDVDVVYIVLPNSHHKDFTLRSFKAGKHVLCEKPMAVTSSECREMIAAAKEADRKLMIAYRLRYEPVNKKAIAIMRKEAVKGGRLGAPRMFEGHHNQNQSAPNTRLNKALGGGPVQDMGIYCLNASRYILGEEPTQVSALAVHPEGDERFKEVPGHATWHCSFPSGALSICTTAFDSAPSNRFRVVCDKGYLEADPAYAYQNLQLRACYVDPETGSADVITYNIKPKNHFAREMDHMAKCVLDNKEPRTPGEEGLKDLLVIEKILESCENNGKMLSIDKA